jgi:hypothetical protein
MWVGVFQKVLGQSHGIASLAPFQADDLRRRCRNAFWPELPEFAIFRIRLSHKRFYDFAVDIRETTIDAVVAEGQLLVVDA